MLTLYFSPGASSMAPHIALHEVGAPALIDGLVDSLDAHEVERIGVAVQRPVQRGWVHDQVGFDVAVGVVRQRFTERSQIPDLRIGKPQPVCERIRQSTDYERCHH